MKRKSITVLLAMLLLVGMCVTAFAVSGETPYTVSLTPSSSSVQVGNTVTVDVNVTPSGWKAMEMELQYDSTKLTLTTTSAGLGNYYSMTDTEGTVMIYRFGDDVTNTKAFTLSFNAIAAGSAEIKVNSACISGGTYAVGDDLTPANLPSKSTVITVTPAGQTVSGTAVSWNNTDDAVYVLYPATMENSAIKAEWNAETPAYTGIVCESKNKGEITANADKKRYDQTFSFEAVPAGNYKLALFKPGKYVPKIISVTVGSEPLNAGNEIKLWLYGDVNYDGKVLATDASQITRKINNQTSVFDSGDEETKRDRLEAGDLIMDGSIKATDASQITRKINNQSSIFDTFK